MFYPCTRRAIYHIKPNQNYKYLFFREHLAWIPLSCFVHTALDLLRPISGSGPHLNTLCVQHSDASPLLRSDERFVWPEKLQKHIWTEVRRLVFALLKLWSALFQKLVPFHSCNYYYNLLFLLLVWITFLPWQIIMQSLKLFTINGYPMDTSSSIRHRLDVEIPREKFPEITSALKGESTWKLWHRFNAHISTWIRLSKSTKYRWVLHMDFSMSFRRQIDVTSVLVVYVLSFSNIFCSGNLSKLFWYNAE